MQRLIAYLLPAILVSVIALPGWSQTSASPSPAQAQPQAGAPAVKKSPLLPYVGTWTASNQGRTFVTMQLVQRGDQLSGSIKHPIRIDTDDNGQVKNFSDDFSTEVVQQSALTGDGVLLTVKDPSTNEVDRFAMQLTGDTTASLKMLAMNMPPGMAKPKPWKLTKSGAATTPVAKP
jgi:hypothetical protein